jgi:hypothetical protein
MTNINKEDSEKLMKVIKDNRVVYDLLSCLRN